MTILIKILRWTKLIVLILFALSGVGMGAVLLPKRERDFDNEVKIELVEGELDEESVFKKDERSQE